VKTKRILFQPGLSMPEFFECCGSDAQCQRALQTALQPALQPARRPSGFVCPNPLLASPRHQSHTTARVAVFAAQHTAPCSTSVTDGLRCLRAMPIVGAEHERVVSGGGRASIMLLQLMAVNI